MTQLDSIKLLLHLKDENITINDITQQSITSGNDTFIFNNVFATLSYNAPRCPNCGFNSTIKQGFINTNHIIAALNSIPVKLRLLKQRFRCKNCASTYVAQSTDLISNNNITEDIKTQVLLLVKQSLTTKVIGQLLGVSLSTIHRFLYSTVKFNRRPLYTLPENLCFD